MPKRPQKDDDEPEVVALIRLTNAAGVEVFHTPDKEAFAIVPVHDHREIWKIRSQRFRLWLVGQFYAEKDQAPSGQALGSARSTLTARAIFDGEEHEVHTRVAEHEAAVYLDLANDDWEAVEITAQGWRVVSDPPVRFRRERGMRPLPHPARGGSIAELRPLVNLPDDASFVLLVAFLIVSLLPRGPYPMLAASGEQGSTKTTLFRMIRELVDPASAPLRTLPRTERDLMIAATHARVLAFDNLSGIPDWLSDAFCRLATGGGFSTRELYTDDEEVIFSAMRPVILNGIEDVVARQDLVDRAILLDLLTLPDERRRTEVDLWAEFETLRPRLLGALLDAVSCALRRRSEVRIDRPPRMADFAHWIVAAEPALPWPPGTFLRAYEENRRGAVETALATDELAVAVRDLMDRMSEVEDTPSAILDLLNDVAGEEVHRRQGWPKAASAMSARLRRLAPGLRRSGIDVSFTRTADRREIRIAQIEAEPRQGRHARHGAQDAEGSDDAEPAAMTTRDENGAGTGPPKSGADDAVDGDDDDSPKYLAEQLHEESEQLSEEELRL